ncbi:MAG: mucoidy inhibitor MuiA family protein [Planctomycetota bacterium]|nr:MAG: mucoidy inhibitor MuiA family protein [Planctomycetota bacterium]
MSPLLLLPLLASLPFQDPAVREVRTRIDRVTVYDGQALVERAFPLSADRPGPVTVVLGPLPLGAEASSFQARVDQGEVEIQGLQIERRSGELAGSERDRLRAELDQVRAALRELESGRAAIEAGQGLVAAATDAVRQDGPPDAGALASLMEFVTGQARRLDEERIALERKEARLRRQAEDLERRLGSGGGAARPYQEARLTLFFERPGEARLRLQYLVGGASWRPVYEVRLDPELSRVDVALTGEVRQSTEEDWADALLLLSSARPHVGLDPPELPRRWAALDFPRPARRRALGYAEEAPAPTVGLALVEADKAASAEDLALEAPSVSVQDFGLSQQFRLPERITLPADGQPKSFPLIQVPLDIRPERYVVPSLSLEAYLRAEVTSAADAPLLPGEARVFLGPDFLGRASFPMLRPGDSTWLNLGVDPDLVVEVAQVRDEREEPGVFSSTVRLHRAWEARLRLSASAPRPVTVLVEEVLPISRDDRITIEPEGIEPAARAEEDDLADRTEKGVWRWRLKLRPGEEKTVRWGWRASFDEDARPVFGED